MGKKITSIIALLCAYCTVFAANYLTFTAEEDSSSFRIYEDVMDDSHVNIQYSLDDGQTWKDLVYYRDTVVLAKKGDKVLLKGNNPNGVVPELGGFRFLMTGSIAASGSVLSLISETEEDVKPEAVNFRGMFLDCTSLTKAPELPATKLTKEECYREMFSGCTRLTEAPALPATQLSERCYTSMFSNCTSLTKAPDLPATQLASGCYWIMFAGCTSLTKAPELPATQ